MNKPTRKGLYGKYLVLAHPELEIHEQKPVTDCFVLRPARDPAALVALEAYAAATDNLELSRDLWRWAADIESKRR